MKPVYILSFTFFVIMAECFCGKSFPSKLASGWGNMQTMKTLKEFAMIVCKNNLGQCSESCLSKSGLLEYFALCSENPRFLFISGVWTISCWIEVFGSV